MKNADLPAMPISVTDTQLQWLMQTNKVVDIGGMTKREYFAGLAMQGLLTGLGRTNLSEDEIYSIVNTASDVADEQLARLERTK